MKKLIFILPAIVLIGLVACKPKHDNEWDPDNPNKAAIEGTVYGMNELPLSNAEILLMQDTFVCDTAWSGTDGAYEITGIDPGLYRLVAYAPHYVPFEHCELESLPADTVANHDVWFVAQHYCFEEEDLGTAQPFGFDTIAGVWRVANDSTAPDRHSTPHVYHGAKTAGGSALTLLKLSAPDFYVETKIKIMSASDSLWIAGVIFRYQDPMNFYFAGITPHGLGINRRMGGVDTPIRIEPGSFPTDTWFDLAVHMYGPEITVNFNGSEYTCNDSYLTTGKAGFFADSPSPGGPVLVNFDDVLISR